MSPSAAPPEWRKHAFGKLHMVYLGMEGVYITSAQERWYSRTHKHEAPAVCIATDIHYHSSTS